MNKDIKDHTGPVWNSWRQYYGRDSVNNVFVHHPLLLELRTLQTFALTFFCNSLFVLFRSFRSFRLRIVIEDDMQYMIFHFTVSSYMVHCKIRYPVYTHVRYVGYCSFRMSD